MVVSAGMARTAMASPVLPSARTGKAVARSRLSTSVTPGTLLTTEAIRSAR